jgi:hypothetical protein
MKREMSAAEFVQWKALYRYEENQRKREQR